MLWALAAAGARPSHAFHTRQHEAPQKSGLTVCELLSIFGVGSQRQSHSFASVAEPNPLRLCGPRCHPGLQAAMEVLLQYSKKRREFGEHCEFSDGPAQMLESTMCS